jgi:hypothetical protein
VGELIERVEDELLTWQRRVRNPDGCWPHYRIRSPPVNTMAGHGRALSSTRSIAEDVTQLLPPVEAIPPVRGKRGRPRYRPDGPYADRACDSAKHRDELRAKGIDPQIARRGTNTAPGSA